MGVEYEFVIDEETKTDHPNTADMDITGVNGYRLSVRGESIGGGKIKIVRINGIDVEFTGEYSTLIVRQIDKPGVVAHITQCLSKEEVNIAFMRLFREDKAPLPLQWWSRTSRYRKKFWRKFRRMNMYRI